ncbi:hypothetical protein Tco_0537994 [Tanacetum coccineum]
MRMFVIVCYEKVVRIPLEGDEILRVHGERTLGAAKALMNAKVDEPRISDIHVARDITDVFLEDLLGLPSQRQVEFRIDLVPRATPVAKSPYRLAPSEMQELSKQLQELEDKGVGQTNCYHQLRVHDDAIPKTAFGMRYRIWSSYGYAFGLPMHQRFHGLNERVCKSYLGRFCHRIHEDFGAYSKLKEEHEVHLKLVLETLRKEKLYAKVSKYSAKKVRDAIGFEMLSPQAVLDNIRCALFEALYGRKCRSPVLWAEIGESSLTGLERKPLEFEVGDRVLLRVSPWKGVVHFRKNGKLALRYVGPFEILEGIGLVAYRLRLPEELNSVHDTFHVLNLKKYLADANFHVPLDEIKVDKTLRFVEKPVEIMD